MRFVISEITPTSAHFEQAFSDDGGKTWEVNWIATDTRVKRRARQGALIASLAKPRPSMRGQLVPDDLAVLHHESNARKLVDVGDRITCYSDEASELAGLDGADAVRPAGISAALVVMARITSRAGIPE